MNFGILSDADGQGGARGALRRSVAAMSYGTVESVQAGRDDYDAQALQEIDQQFQISISGEIGAEAIVASTDIEFDAPFLNAIDERPSPYSDPTFTSGIVQTRGAPVLLHVAVIRWTVDEGMFYRGARIRIVAEALPPDPDAPVLADGELGEFTAEVHLNFQGYGSPVADDPDEGVEEG